MSATMGQPTNSTSTTTFELQLAWYREGPGHRATPRASVATATESEVNHDRMTDGLITQRMLDNLFQERARREYEYG